jgi:hypothetical protein
MVSRDRTLGACLMGWRNAATGTKIAVRLSTASGVGVNCRVGSADGPSETVRLISVSIREAEREITARLIEAGFTPLNRWFERSAKSQAIGESARNFVRD